MHYGQSCYSSELSVTLFKKNLWSLITVTTAQKPGRLLYCAANDNSFSKANHAWHHNTSRQWSTTKFTFINSSLSKHKVLGLCGSCIFSMAQPLKKHGKLKQRGTSANPYMLLTSGHAFTSKLCVTAPPGVRQKCWLVLQPVNTVT